MFTDHHNIEETLLALAARGVRCTVTIREDATERRIQAVISSATSESVVLHETGTASIHVYPTACVVAAEEDPTGAHRVRDGRHRHPSERWEAMLVHL